MKYPCEQGEYWATNHGNLKKHPCEPCDHQATQTRHHQSVHMGKKHTGMSKAVHWEMWPY